MTAQSSRRFAIGVQSFPVMRQGGFVYVDKTHHVWQLSNCFGNYILLSRPRRFGKSLLCSTFKAYFEGRRELFEDLRIAKMDSAWRSHAVMFFDMSTLKDIDAPSESLDDALPLFYQSGNLTIKHYVLFGTIGIRAETEVRNAVGRSDVVLHTKDTTYVMELKLDGRGTVDDALQQIDSRN